MVLQTDQTFADELLEHAGARGFWLRTPALEAFVAVEPVFRLLALRQPDRASLLADAPIGQEGLRLAFMGPGESASSPKVGNQPATILQKTERTAHLKLGTAEGLRYSIQLELDEHRPFVQINYALENTGEDEREVAGWTLASFAKEGKILVPFGSEPRSRRRLVLPWWTAWPQPGAHFGITAMAFEPGVPLVGNAVKIGVITHCGWIAMVRNDQALISHSPFIIGATYPEDGANVTLFAGETHCEIEQLSPLRKLKPGEILQHSESLELIALAPPLPDDPDALRAQIESARNHELLNRISPPRIK